MTALADACAPVLRAFARPVRWGLRTVRLIPLGREPQWRRIDKQFYMRIDPRDWMDRAFYLGSYERHLVHLIGEMVRPGDVCIDIGAQKGFITLHLANAVGATGQVIAFEPDPRAMEALTSNVRYNEFNQVRLHSCALGDSEAYCDFALSNQLGWSSRFPNHLAKPAVASDISVRTRCLDDVIAEMGVTPETHRVSFVKIDAEGSEPLILRGALETLRRFRPTVHLEVNNPSLHAGGFSADSIEIPLTSLGYRLYSVRWNMAGFPGRRLSLIPVASLTADVGECGDVLALSGTA